MESAALQIHHFQSFNRHRITLFVVILVHAVALYIASHDHPEPPQHAPEQIIQARLLQPQPQHHAEPVTLSAPVLPQARQISHVSKALPMTLAKTEPVVAQASETGLSHAPSEAPMQAESTQAEPIQVQPTQVHGIAADSASTAAKPSNALPEHDVPALEPPRFNADYLDNPSPVYPKLSRKVGEQGRVLLRVHVNERGLPLAVLLKNSSGFERLDEAAIASVQRWKFVPAQLEGKPVEAWVVVPITFSLKG